jgi:PST family polysaccharide transporter
MAATKRIAKGLAWLVGGRFANAAISMVSTAVLARLLGPEDFGVMAAAFVVLALANVLFDGAFGVNLIRKAALTEEDVRTTLTVAVLVGAALAGLVALASPAAESFFKFKLLAPTLAISSLTIPLKAVFSVASAQLQRHGRFRVLAMASIFAQFVGYILVAVPMALMGFGIWSLIAALVVSGFTEAATVGVMARLPLKPAFHREALKDIRGSGLFGLSYAFNWIANTGANAVIGRMLGAAPLGLYSRGWKLLDLVVAATATPLQRVLMPAFANIQAHPERLKRAFISALEVSLPIYALASVLLALQAPVIVSITLGPKWSDTVPVAQILFATLVPRCVFKISESFAVAVGKSGAAAWRQGFYAAMMVTSSIIGSRYGIYGVAIGVSLSITIFYVTSMSYATRISGSTFWDVVAVHLRSLLLALAVGVVDAGVLRLLHGFHLVIQHFLAGGAGVLVAGALVAASPTYWLGQETGGRLINIKTRLMARLATRFTAAH